MSKNVWSSAWEKVRRLAGRMFASKPHFDFISAHYIWIITATMTCSVFLYGDGSWGLSYTDALLFASGSSTQAGLNPVDVNLLNTFQQIVMYIFPMMTNPIVIHGSVVVLRLYWFEKRFQTVVKDAKKRRVPLSRTKSKMRPDDDVHRAEAGINAADISRVPGSARPVRVTNDGTIVNEEEADDEKKAPRNSDESDATLAAQTRWRWHGGNAEPSEDGPATPPHPRQRQRQQHQNHYDADDDEKADHDPNHTTPAITFTFADDPKTEDDSDGPTNFSPLRRHTEHITILERQRNQNHDDVLRIPTPQEAEMGFGPQSVGPRRLGLEDGQARPRRSSMASRLEPPALGARNTRRRATVTIAEPEPREPGRRDDTVDEPRSWGGAEESVQFRRPRFHDHRLHHHDGTRKASTAHDAGHRKTSVVPQRPPCGPRSKTLDTIRTAISGYEGEHEMPYLSYAPTVGRNSNFIGLTLEQREELGGIEYRSLKTLVYILLSYYWGFQLLAVTFLLPYILHNQKYGRVVTDVGVGRPWWAFWTASGAFNDVGFALNPDSMISFQGSSYVLMIMSLFIIIGNAGFPVMLRFVIWVMSCIVPKGTGLWEELRFLLDHPRRCFTLLFPSNANWWLFFTVISLTVIDVVFFIILDLHSSVVQDLPVGSRIVNGIFMAASTRTAGFASLPIPDLHPAMPVLYMIMMYIGVFPIAISIRRTNVYEEKSLGIYESGVYEDEFDMDHVGSTPMSYVGNHLRRQLSFDLWFVVLAFFLLAISEGSKLKDGRFNLFSVLFETVSAYGTVGLSIGVPNVNASLCSQFSVIGKLLIVVCQIRGRHRGLPYGLDRAVILPSESRFMSDNDLVPHDEFTHGVTSSAVHPAMAGGAFSRQPSMHSTRRVSAYNRRISMHGRRASMVSTRRRSSLAMVGQLLHPGPSVPPGVVHSHRRNSRSQDHLALNAQRGARRWPSVSWHPPAVMEEDDEYYDDAITPMTPRSDNNLRLAQTLSPTSTPSTSTPSTCTPPTR